MASSPSSLSREQQWQHWAAQAQGGDKRAYHALLKDISPFIRAVAAPSLANEDWLDDLVQNVLLSVHKALATYSPDRPFKPWLLAIIHFRRSDVLRQYYRKQADKQAHYDDVPEAILPVTNPTRAGEYKDIESALAALPEKQRTVFMMMRVEGYTAKEVAKQMDMSVSAVKVSVHRTLKKLKDDGLDG